MFEYLVCSIFFRNTLIGRGSLRLMGLLLFIYISLYISITAAFNNLLGDRIPLEISRIV